MVSREEFEVVRDMAAAARAQQEAMAGRLSELEAKLAETAAKVSAKAAPTRRAARRAGGRTQSTKKPASK